MTLLFVLIFLDLSSYPGCLPGLYFVQGSLFLAGRTGSYMAAVSKVIKHPITEANNRKIDKKNYLNPNKSFMFKYTMRPNAVL